MEDSAEGEKICLENINMGNYSMLDGEDRCPSLVEKSSAQFVFRIVLYLVMFTINVILLNVLIGQISFTLGRVMKEGDKDYIVRASLSGNLDLELHKKVFLEFVNSI